MDTTTRETSADGRAEGRPAMAGSAAGGWTPVRLTQGADAIDVFAVHEGGRTVALVMRERDAHVIAAAEIVRDALAALCDVVSSEEVATVIQEHADVSVLGEYLVALQAAGRAIERARR